MQTTIDNLAAEVEMLKKTVENSGLSVNVPDSATVTDASATTSVIQRNEAAERNNANVILYDGNEKLAQIISKNSEFLASEVLATEVKAGLGANTKEWTVNGEKITLSIEKA